MATQNVFTQRRDELIRNANLQWFANSFGQTLNEKTRDVLKKVVAVPPYDVYQVEQLLTDIATLLDRCLVYRKEYEQLDTTAVKALLDDQLFLDQLSSLKTIELAESLQTQHEAERAQQAIAAGKFAGIDGRRWMSLAGVASNDEAIKGEIKRKAAVRDKWSKLERYMATLRDRYQAPGSSFNYQQRAERVLRFYLADIAEAYQKSRAVQKSLNSVCGINSPFPALSSDQFLDDLVVWNRAVIDQFELFREADVEFEIIVYVRQPDGGGRQLVNDAAFNAAMSGNGELTLDLSNYFPSTINFLRVRGIGMSISMNGNLMADLQRLKLYRMSAVVFPPQVLDPFPPPPPAPLPVTYKLARRPSLLTNITITDPNNPVRLAAGPNINNLDPRGTWTIKLGNTVGYPDTERRQRPSDITDVKLHLSLVGQPDPDTSHWSNVQI